MNTGTRPYVMTARARAVEETATRMVEAFTTLFVERPFAQITLREVAERAGVSVQTLIRHFGDKDGLTAAAAAHGAAAVAEQRAAAVPGDVAGSVAVLVDHYEAYGVLSLRLLAEEDSSPAVAVVARAGRDLHRDWCARVFAPFLRDLSRTDHDRRLAQLVAVCDVWTWRLLRDAGLGPDQVRLALTELLAPLTSRSA